MASSSSYPHSLPASSSSQSCKYDVFISFRGEDTRKTFVDHLYTAIRDRLISVYKDDEALPRGDSISQSLFKAIEDSEIAVVIFSENYANSSWCLEELAYIMKCKEDRNLIVVPIFYGVDPSIVRKQKGKFGEAFVKHDAEHAGKAESWRKSLVDASEIAGWDPKNIANGYESNAIKKIVDVISHKLFSLTSSVDEEYVGMEARLQEVEDQLEIGSGGVLMVGIWGVGGGGKTTLATYQYMKINSRFEGHCIIDKIREVSVKNGLKSIQEIMLSRLLKTQIAVQSVQEGKARIRDRLRRSKVLIILDDVDHIDQLDALAGTRSWFGSGSRIIITTRNEQLLKAHKVDKVCPVTLLNRDEAIQLFNKRAYDEKGLVKEYETLSSSVVSYCAGLPLTLKILGSSLCGRDEKMWKSTLARLKDIPEKGTMETLKISYDGLEADEKALFLDIACFFRGYGAGNFDQDDNEDFNVGIYSATDKLKACGYHLGVGIEVLKQKTLIHIKDGRFDMHDLVQEMAHYIVRGEHPHNPENHSRIWREEDIRTLCFGDATMENDRIEMIKYSKPYDFSKPSDVYPLLFCKIVSKLKKLRYIVVDPGCLSVENTEVLNFLSNELRYISWIYFPGSRFPDSFKPTKLVVLHLYRGYQRVLWKNSKHLPHLKVLHLSYMDSLLRTPNFNDLPCLVRLKIYFCHRLEEIHPSFGNHTSLRRVSVSFCDNLGMLPTIIKMEKLRTLKISGCHENLEFPEIKSNMESLVKLYLDRIGIDALLSSIVERCANLDSLMLMSCFYLKSKKFNFDRLNHLKKLKLHGLNLREGYGSEASIWLRGVFPQMTRNIQKLNLSDFRLRDGEIPSDIGNLFNLQALNLGGNNFTRLHFSLVQLTRLKKLNLSGCKQLTELPELPLSMFKLQANYCSALSNIGDVYKNCKRLCQVSFCGGGIINDAGELLEHMIRGNAFEDHHIFLIVNGLKIAKGFMALPLIIKNRFTLKLPQNWHEDYCGFLVYVVLKHRRFYNVQICIKKQEVSGTDTEDDEESGREEQEVSGTDTEDNEESGRDVTTLVWYVPFSQLRCTQWWGESHKSVELKLGYVYESNPRDVVYEINHRIWSEFEVRMVAKKNGSGPKESITTQEQLKYAKYIHSDSMDGLILNLPFRLYRY